MHPGRLLPICGYTQSQAAIISWTIAEQKPEVEDSKHNRRRGRERSLHLWNWNRFLFGWTTRLANLLTVEESQRHILDPVKDCWRDVPRLTAELMQNYIFINVGTADLPTTKAQLEWRQMCGWVLDDLQHRENLHYHYDSDEADAIALIVFVRHSMVLVEEDRAHINIFSDIIDRWVAVVGGNPDAYSFLLIMLSEAGRGFTPEPALAWLSRSVEAASDASTLFEEHQNGVRTAELLQRIWRGAEEQVRADGGMLRRFSTLLDYLVLLGIPLASMLQQKLEERS